MECTVVIMYSLKLQKPETVNTQWLKPMNIKVLLTYSLHKHHIVYLQQTCQQIKISNFKILRGNFHSSYSDYLENKEWFVSFDIWHVHSLIWTIHIMQYISIKEHYNIVLIWKTTKRSYNLWFQLWSKTINQTAHWFYNNCCERS